MTLKNFLPYAVLLSTLLSAGCFARYIEVDNQDGRVSSIGPVYEVEAGVFAMTISVADYEGDPVDIELYWRTSGGEWQEIQRCPNDGLCAVSGLKALHTRTRGEDTPHTITLQSSGAAIATLELRAQVRDDDANAITWPGDTP